MGRGVDGSIQECLIDRSCDLVFKCDRYGTFPYFVRHVYFKLGNFLKLCFDDPKVAVGQWTSVGNGTSLMSPGYANFPGCSANLFASTHAVRAKSMDSVEEMKGKVGIFWRIAASTLNTYQNGLNNPMVKVFKMESDSIAEFCAISVSLHEFISLPSNV